MIQYKIFLSTGRCFPVLMDRLRVKLKCCHGNDRCGMTVLVDLLHISGNKGFQKKLLVPEVGQFIEAYSVYHRFETLAVRIS